MTHDLCLKVTETGYFEPAAMVTMKEAAIALMRAIEAKLTLQPKQYVCWDMEVYRKEKKVYLFLRTKIYRDKEKPQAEEWLSFPQIALIDGSIHSVRFPQIDYYVATSGDFETIVEQEAVRLTALAQRPYEPSYI